MLDIWLNVIYVQENFGTGVSRKLMHAWWLFGWLCWQQIRVWLGTIWTL